ncbi:MAG: hypothetical protein K0R67_3729 [Paenibacillus sp.]|jgi:hypothetical protein|nr:hypothetical protein [Paenibacillus sp.]
MEYRTSILIMPDRYACPYKRSNVNVNERQPLSVNEGGQGQTDYVRLLREHNDIPESLYAKVTGDRFIEVLVPFKGTCCAHYGFGKNPNDDFILFRDGAVSDLERITLPTGGYSLTAVKRFDVLLPWSNKEYAICVSPVETGYKHQWLPEHNQVGTVFAVKQRVYFDNIEITDWTKRETFRSVESVRIEQSMLGIHPDDPKDPVAEINCTHTVDRNGVSVCSAIKWLRPVSIRAGYGMMFPAVRSFADKLATSLGHLYEATAADGSRTNLIDDDRSISYAFMHTPEGPDGQHNIVAAMTVRNIAKTFRCGQTGRRTNNSVVWLEHRNESIQKLYPQVYDNYNALPGEIYEAAGTYYIGELPAVKRG